MAAANIPNTIGAGTIHAANPYVPFSHANIFLPRPTMEARNLSRAGLIQSFDLVGNPRLYLSRKFRIFCIATRHANLLGPLTLFSIRFCVFSLIPPVLQKGTHTNSASSIYIRKSNYRTRYHHYSFRRPLQLQNART